MSVTGGMAERWVRGDTMADDSTVWRLFSSAELAAHDDAVRAAAVEEAAVAVEDLAAALRAALPAEETP